MKDNPSLPDIAASHIHDHELKLDRVGLDEVLLAIKIDQLNAWNHLIARASVYVDLSNPKARGIHMSRLFALTSQAFAQQPLSRELILNTCQLILESHKGLSHQVDLKLSFELPVEAPSLVSGLTSTKFYRVEVDASLSAERTSSIHTTFHVTYSSTCPCSASLARELNAAAFARDFPSESVRSVDVLDWLRNETKTGGVPHAQKSLAIVSLHGWSNLTFSGLLYIINEIEDALGTPTQTLVKRKDEQEFARLNARNLMFVEDAARRIGKKAKNWKECRRVRARVVHMESLHPFDVSATFILDL
jgi:GTP cyclohydrolase I